MAREDGDRVGDILAAIADIRSDTAGMDYATFAQTPVVVRSVLYSIGVIGEAAKALSAEFKATHPTIPWRASPASGTVSCTSISVPIPDASGRW